MSGLLRLARTAYNIWRSRHNVMRVRIGGRIYNAPANDGWHRYLKPRLKKIGKVLIPSVASIVGTGIVGFKRRRAPYGRRVTRPDGGTYANSLYRAPRSTTGASTQYTVTRRRAGRYKSRRSAWNKLVNRDMWYAKYQARFVAPFNNSTAALTLWNWRNTSGGTNGEYPLHIFSIDARPPSANDSTGDNCFWAMGWNSITNMITWTPITADNPTTGVASAYNGYHCVLNSQGSGNSLVPDKSVLNYVKADFILRGVASRPTTYKIQFVQFLHPDIHPTATVTNETTKFWVDYIKPCLVSPLSSNPKDFHSRYHMRVLKTYYHRFQPDETNNKDTVPIQKRFKFTYGLNRLVDFTPRINPKPASIVSVREEDGIQDINENTVNYTGQLPPQHKARIYMIVTALAFDQANVKDATTNALMPQYDVVLEQGVTFRS